MTPRQGLAAELESALLYEAPFLIEKLLKDRIVDSTDEGEALFSEVKKYLVLVQSDRTKSWQMYSLRVDEVWHQFILFTREYMSFCQRFFGRYIPHSPSNSPEPEDAKGGRETSSFEQFEARYRELFGVQLPDIWFDERSVKPWRRVLNDHAGALAIRQDGDAVDLLTSDGEVVLSVNDIAREALIFLTHHGAFYVRELPGDLDDEEKVALVSTLVEYNVLRVGV